MYKYSYVFQGENTVNSKQKHQTAMFVTVYLSKIPFALQMLMV